MRGIGQKFHLALQHHQDAGYILEHSRDNPDDWFRVSTGTSTQFSDTPLNPETTYYFRVSAYNAHGSSDWSQAASAETPGGPAVELPTVATLGHRVTSVTTAELTGQVASDGGGTITERGMEIEGLDKYRADTAGTGNFTVTVSGPDFQSNAYQYRAYAVNSAGTGYGEYHQMETGGGIHLYQSRYSNNQLNEQFYYYCTTEPCGAFDAQAIRSGNYERWYINGQIKEQGRYDNGKKTGTWKAYYEDGTPKSETAYSDDVFHGSYKRWHENGQMEIEGQYEHGKTTGTWKEYYENATPKSESTYSDDVFHGVYKGWYGNGGMKIRGQYEQGDKQGTWTEYDLSGLKTAERFYANNRVTREMLWDYYTNHELEKETSLVYEDGNTDKTVVRFLV